MLIQTYKKLFIHHPYLNFSTMGDILDPPGLSLLAATWPPIGLCSGSSLNRPVMLDLDPEPDIAPLRSQENSTLSVQSFVFSVTQFRFKGNQIHGKSGIGHLPVLALLKNMLCVLSLQTLATSPFALSARPTLLEVFSGCMPSETTL